MATEQFRGAVQAELEAWRLEAYPDVPAFYENGPVPDENTIGLMWIDCMVRWYAAKLVSMGTRPLGRHTGTVLTNVYFREGEGSRDPDQVLDSIKEHLRARRLGGGVLYMPQRSVPTKMHGWYKVGLLTPFTLDDA